MKIISLSAAVSCLALSSAALADTPVLTVMSYDAFIADWGPGPKIEQAFEEICGCDLRFIDGGDGAATLARLQLEGANTEADIVLGLDTNLTAQAKATGLFIAHDQPAAAALPVPYEDSHFLPFDWSWLAFVYDKTKVPNPPESLDALAASDLKVVIQDPRSSTPGLALVMWVEAAKGEGAADYWKALSDNILTVTPGWSEAYGLFTDGETDMVLSYSTSPAYHRLAEGDDSKDWAAFSDGHYLQVEVGGILASTKQPELAKAFMGFTQSPAFQSLIPEGNWSYPVTNIALPEGFETKRPEKSLIFDEDEALARRADAVAQWQAALAR